jgi:hypothetical protein
MKKLTRQLIKEKLAGYDLIFVALDHRALETVVHITSACGDRLVTYSEGNIADYQMHSPAGQTDFLQMINQARMNFLYWEKYVPFYRTLTDRPVAYLPYPYFYQDVEPFKVPVSQRLPHATLPSGLAGNTRNGLGSLVVARQLLSQQMITQVNCWLSAGTFAEDAQAIQFFMSGKTPPPKQTSVNWRQWLRKTGVDYRFLLNVKRLWRKPQVTPPPPMVQANQLALYRRRAWPLYLPEMAKTKLIIDMNTRETVGRNSLDGAAAGVPCLSTNRSDMQGRLFPDITLQDGWDVKEAVDLSRKLLQDKAFYQAVVARAAKELTQFGPEGFQKRFAAVLEEYPQLAAKRFA